MKKILSLVVILLMVASLAFAATDQRGNPIIISRICTTCVHVTTSPALLYGMVIRANTAQGWGAIIDSNTTGGYDSTGAFVNAQYAEGATQYRAFVGEATQYDTVQVMYDPPLRCSNGIFFYDGIGSQVASGGDGVTAIVYYSND